MGGGRGGILPRAGQSDEGNRPVRERRVRQPDRDANRQMPGPTLQRQFRRRQTSPAQT